ncbi:hypothetical protein F383_38006 [Gossypium arboreum]|uniref:Uncharacterized protein n=1 Tax=Gossypium arboreum TaxID=29729 RepID=A0A0B0MDI6_GOSAR|nr:hypothetical protein F383_38006 [Gossypium arboreum]
MCCRKGFSPGG